MALAADAAAYAVVEESMRAKEEGMLPASASVAPGGREPSTTAGGGVGDFGASAPSTSATASGPSGMPAASAAVSAGSAGGGGGDGRHTHSQALHTMGGKAQLQAHLRDISQRSADEASRPIAVAHAILSDVSMRLLVNAAVDTVTRLLSGPHGRWAGQAEVTPAVGFSPGLRVSYWLHAAHLLSTPAAVSAADASTPAGATAAAAACDHGRPPLPALGGRAGDRGGAGGAGEKASPSGGHQHYLELGIGPSGQVLVRHFPPLLPLHAAESDVLFVPGGPSIGASGSGGGGGPVLLPPDLTLDSETLNVDELLLRVAAHAAAGELLAVRATLAALLSRQNPGLAVHAALRVAPLAWVRAGAEKGFREAVITAAADPDRATSASGGGASTPLAGGSGGAGGGGGAQPTAVVAVPQLELCVEGMLLLVVSKSLFSGRLLLAPGPGLGFDAQVDHQVSYAHKEGEINKAVVTANSSAAIAKDRDESAGGAALSPGMGALCVRLAKVLGDLQRHANMVRCITSARRLCMHLGGLSKCVLNAAAAAAPWLNLRRNGNHWSFEPMMFPQSFPPLRAPRLPAAPNGQRHHNSDVELRGLCFVLASDPFWPPGGSLPSWPPAYSLIVCGCTAGTVPARVLKVVPVPTMALLGGGGSPDKSTAPAAAAAAAAAAATQAPSRMGSLTHIGGTGGGGGHEPTHGATPGLVWTPPGTALPCDAPTPPLHFHGADAATPRLSTGCASAAPQRDISSELEVVAGWCRTRMHWERLLASLSALRVPYAECVSAGSSYRLVLEGLPGLPLPFHAERRSDSSGAHTSGTATTSAASVGIDSVVVELLPGARRAGGGGSACSGFVARVAGAFFADPASARAVAGAAAAACSSSGGSGGLGAGGKQTRGGGGGVGGGAAHGLARVLLQAQGSRAHGVPAHCLSPASASGGGDDPATRTAAPDANGSLHATSPHTGVGAPLELRYSYSRGHSAADLVRDLLALARMTRMLARLEALAQPPGAALAVVEHRHHSTAGAGMGAGAECEKAAEPAAKRARTGRAAAAPAPTQNGGHHHHLAVGGDGGRAKPPVDVATTAAAGSATATALTWRWPANGTVSLARYGYSAATLSYTSPTARPTAEPTAASCAPTSGDGNGAGATGGAGGGGEAAGCCSVHLQVQWHGPDEGGCGMSEAQADAWRAACGGGTDGSSEAGGGAPECCTVACHMRELPSRGDGSGGGGSAAATIRGLLPPDVRAALADMAGLGNEGLLLDALVLTAWPMMQLQSLTLPPPLPPTLSAQRAAGPGPGSGMGAERGAVFGERLVLLPTCPPFEQRVVCPIGSGWWGPAGTAAGAPGQPPQQLAASAPTHLVLDVSCTAAAKTWLKLSAVCGGGVSSTSGSEGAGSSSSATLSAVQRALAGEDVDVVACVGVKPGGGGGWKGHGPMWMLVDNQHLGAVVRRIARAVA
ncbi:hypothetical protein FOA52_002148 [Chlamydomonas sp. UWO 241]|nr:hypothetical protein FOA52_002148 [Chlamydomonas sp. UWO 241]